MKKKQKGLNGRAIRRKMGLQPKDINEMIQNVNHLLEENVFTAVSNDKEYVTVNKKQLVNVLKGQVVELETELKKLHTEDNKKTNIS